MTSRADPTKTWTACPHCGLTLPTGRVVCNGCGVVVPIEMAGRRVRSLGPRLLGSFMRRFEADHATFFIWALACVPFLVAPPACALVLTWLRRRQGTQPSTIEATDQTTWVLVVAITNIVVSIAFWLVAGHHVTEALGAALGSLWDWLDPYQRLPLGRSPVRTYPIGA